MVADAKQVISSIFVALTLKTTLTLMFDDAISSHQMQTRDLSFKSRFQAQCQNMNLRLETESLSNSDLAKCSQYNYVSHHLCCEN